MKMYSFAKMRTLAATGLIIFAAHFQVFSQTYQVNGSAVDNGNGLVRMTTSQASVAQTASAWNTTKIDLTQTFDKSFELFFGCNKDPLTGGDGMTFTFHNDPRALNALGDNFGFLGLGGGTKLTPAISIEFDTYDASGTGGGNEIPEDHIALDINGDVNQDPTKQGNGFINFIGVNGTSVHNQAINGGIDLEDCSTNYTDNYYTIQIVWTYTDEFNQSLQLYEEGILTLTYSGNLINTIFSGNSMVYWGFTGATGSAANEQWIAPVGSIIPWECDTDNSCCLPFTVIPTSPTTICNTPITLSVDETYDSYSWSDGSTNATTEITMPGTYTLNVLQIQQPGNISCPGSATFTITPTGPTAVLSGGATLCNNTLTTPLSVALTGSMPWTFVYAIDGVNQPPITTSTPNYQFDVNGPHVYSLVSVADNSGCTSNATGTATVDLFPGIPVGNDDIFTAPGTADLSVDNDGGTYVWYDAPTGGNVVHNGANFPTPVLNGTTTYYVENTSVTNVIQKNISFVNRDEGNGTNLNNYNGNGLPRWDLWVEFKANSSFTLDRVTTQINVVLPWQAGSGLNIYIDDQTTPANNATINSIFPAPLPQDTQSVNIPINYSFIAGHNYRLSYEGINSVKGILYWQMVSGYPINNDPEITLTNSAQNTTYPGIFNWIVSVPSPSSSCGRTPVTAYTCPTAVLSGNAAICNDGSTATLTVALTGRAPYTLIYAMDGVNQPAITGINTQSYTFQSAPGAYTYSLVSVSNADCSGTVSGSAAVTLTAGAPVGIDDNFTAPGTADLGVVDEGDTYEWYDAPTGGSLVHTGADFPTPVLNGTTTYYVNNASIVNVIEDNISFANRDEGNGTNLNNYNGNGLPRWDLWVEFKANSNFTLDRVTTQINVVLPWQAGSGLNIYIDDQTTPANNATINSIFPAPLPQDTQSVVIPINYSFIAGHNYRLSYEGINSVKGILYWQMVSGYPINNDPEITLTNSAQNTTYPGIFNWKISMISSTPACGRTPVTAYVCPTAALTGDAVICDDGTTTTELSVALTGASPWSLTYAIDGVAQPAITGITTPSPYKITSATGAHVYTLVSVSNATSTGCANGTSGTATVTVNPDAPVANDVTFLPGDAANLAVDSPTGTYNWFAAASGGTSVHTGATYSPVLTETTTFYVQHLDANGDTSCARTPVTAYLCPTAALSGDAVICNDGTTTTDLSVALTGASPWTLTYAIDGVSQTTITGITTPNPYLITSATGAHVYTLVSVTNATSTGCANGTSGIATVTINPDAPVGHDATFVSPGSAVLTVDDNVGSTFNWYDAVTGGNLVNTGFTYTTPTLTVSTTYYVEQVIGGQISCTRTPVSAIVFVPTVPLFIPNLMTPNNDGKNDRFEIKGLPDGSSLGIYNRWGNAVYQSDNYDNQWAAENISAGVYYYDLKLKNGENYKGWLQIIW